MEKRIQQILSCRDKNCIEDERFTRAAVLIPLFRKKGEYHLLLTRRAQSVAHHRGQISFPGGRRDPQDPDLLSTALREAWEEVGIHPQDVTLLGELDDVCTLTTDFCVSPFVGLIPYPYLFEVNPREIQEVIEVPLAVLLDERKFREELHMQDEEPVPILFYQHQNHTIWGATARILKQLLDLLPEEDKMKVREREKG